MSIEAMKQALEALEDPIAFAKGHAAITALRAAIAEAEKQEPVAWLYWDSWGAMKLSQIMPPPVGAFPVYTAPPAAERNKVAQWMMAQGYATGHGDTVEDLLKELEWQVRESERNACAAIARQWDVDHQGSNYGGCIANLIEAREQDAA